MDRFSCCLGTQFTLFPIQDNRNVHQPSPQGLFRHFCCLYTIEDNTALNVEAYLRLQSGLIAGTLIRFPWHKSNSQTPKWLATSQIQKLPFRNLIFKRRANIKIESIRNLQTQSGLGSPLGFQLRIFVEQAMTISNHGSCLEQRAFYLVFQSKGVNMGYNESIHSFLQLVAVCHFYPKENV